MEPSQLTWYKASYSGTNGGGCVEVSTNLPGMVAIRDSKDPTGPFLTVTPDEWTRFITQIRANT